MQPNRIVLTVQPDEGVSVSLGAKIPGAQMRIRPVNMEFRYETLPVAVAESYERLLLDAMRGDATLFTRDDEIEALWGIVDPILAAWEADTFSPIPQYPAGSTGPSRPTLSSRVGGGGGGCEREPVSARPPAPQVIALGPPGAGKGTQAARLASQLGAVHINPGRILREKAGADSVLGRQIAAAMAAGELCPTNSSMWSASVSKHSPPGRASFSRLPAHATEAESRRRMLAALGRLEHRPVTVWLEVPRGELLRRLRGRRHTEGRPDVRAAIAPTRLHDAQAGALRDSLMAWTDVMPVDGGRAAEAVTEDILSRLRAPRDHGVASEPPGPNTRLSDTVPSRLSK